MQEQTSEKEEDKAAKDLDAQNKDCQYEVIQDFHNKRANAFASLFVASMFGLFTLLSLMERIVDLTSPLILLILCYLTVFGFGLYSLLNFSYYATVAQIAKWQIKDVQKTETKLLEGITKERTWFFRSFAYLKVRPLVAASKASKQKQGYFKWSAVASGFIRYKDHIFVIFYFVIGLLPLIVLWLLRV